MSDENIPGFQEKLSFIAGQIYALRILTATALVNAAGEKTDPIGFLNRAFDSVADAVDSLQSNASPDLMEITKIGATELAESMRDGLITHWETIWTKHEGK